MPVTHVDGVELHHREAGDGPAVLLLHGSLGSSADWQGYVDLLASKGFRALALDERGHGASTRFGEAHNPWDRLEVKTFVDDASAFLDVVAPSAPVHVVGHSRGATVGGWLAFELGAERVASFTAAASPPMATEAFRMAWRKVRDETPAPSDYRGELRLRTFDYLSRIPDDAFPAEYLTQYRGPGFVAEGADDPYYNPTHTMFWRAWLKDAEVARAPGGHDFPFDGGAGERWFRERLVAFLQGAARA